MIPVHRDIDERLTERTTAHFDDIDEVNVVNDGCRWTLEVIIDGWGAGTMFDCDEIATTNHRIDNGLIDDMIGEVERQFREEGPVELSTPETESIDFGGLG